MIRDDKPLSIDIGNPNLKNSLSNSFELSYENNKRGSFSASISLDITSNAIVNIIEFMPSDRDTVIDTTKPSANDDQGYIPQRGAMVSRTENRSGEIKISSSIRYGLYIKPLASLSLSFNYYYSKANAYDGMTDFIQNHGTRLNLSLVSNIAKNLDFNLLFSNDFSVRLMNGYDRYSVHTNGVSGQFSYSFFKIMNGGLSGIWYNQKQFNSNISANNSLQINATLGVYLNYGRNLLLSVNCHNLSNNKSGVLDLMTNTYFIHSISDGFGRYISAKLSYKFNSMNKKPKLKKSEKTNSGGFFNN